jgi:hypothetical protein
MAVWFYSRMVVLPWTIY